ncbi:MAG: hypothetical protein AAGA48_20755 [Myxococcota bacterium]
MVHWLLCLGVDLGVAQAQSPATEKADASIIVYGDALAPWQNTRWWVTSETMGHPMRLSLDGQSFIAPAWQAEAIVKCTVTDPKRRGGWVECTVEQAAMRIVTVDHWQHPKDRKRVDRFLALAATELQGHAIRFRVHELGTITIAKEQPDTKELASQVIGPALEAFHIEFPEGGWKDGAEWSTPMEPLLQLNRNFGSYGFEKGVHYANEHEGQRVIQTLAQAERTVVVGVVTEMGLIGRPSRDGLQGRFGRAADRFLPDDNSEDGRELTEKGSLELHAVAIFDERLGGIRERVWTIQGRGAATLFRSGRLRKLEEDEVVTLGTSGQVRFPGQAPSNLPLWTTVSTQAR